MTEPTIAMMVEIAEDLRGTCKSLDEVLITFGLSFDGIPQELLGRLDDEVMECQVCGWWYETHDLNDDQICNECEEE